MTALSMALNWSNRGRDASHNSDRSIPLLFFFVARRPRPRHACRRQASSRGLLTALSRLIKVTRSLGPRGGIIFQVHHGARVAELADAPDLGSGGVTHGGSSPPFRTIKSNPF